MLNNKTLALNTAAQYPFVFLAATAKQGLRLYISDCFWRISSCIVKLADLPVLKNKKWTS
ncbi:MAG TPA: hypothetical protein DEQ51_00405 [Alphaproteobacteria bacterium]|nr:hypothetical protein [Alphaproteobacteria bacterium]